MSSRSEHGEGRAQPVDAADLRQNSLSLTTTRTVTGEKPITSVGAMGLSEVVLQPGVQAIFQPPQNLTIGAEARIQRAPQGPITDVTGVDSSEHDSRAGKTQGTDTPTRTSESNSQPRGRGTRARGASAAAAWIQSGAQPDERTKATTDSPIARAALCDDRAEPTADVVIIMEDEPKNELVPKGDVFDIASTRHKKTVDAPYQEADPSLMDEASVHFTAITERHKIASSWIADTMGTNPQNISKFIHTTGKVNLNWLIIATEQFLDPQIIRDDPDMQELHRIRSTIEEPQWLRVFSEPNLTLGNSLELLRVAQLLSVTNFTKKAQVGNVQYSLYELDKQKPNEENLNKIIDASPLDPHGKPAQLVRLKNEKMKPMHLSDLQTSSFGELYQQVRVTRGLSRKKLAEKLFTAKTTIAKLERKRHHVDMVSLPNHLKALGVNPESALAAIFYLKAADAEALIPTSLLQQVLEEESIVLQEHMQFETENTLSRREQDIYEAVENERTAGGMLRRLREILDIDPNQYKNTGKNHGNFEIHAVTIDSIEKEEHVPEVQTAAAMVKQYTEWGPFHPVTRLIVAASRRHRFAA